MEEIPYEDKSEPFVHLKAATNPSFRPTLLSDEEIDALIDPSKDPTIEACLVINRKRYCGLTRRLWSHNPADRPKFEEALDELEQIDEQLKDYFPLQSTIAKKSSLASSSSSLSLKSMDSFNSFKKSN